jgi:hypothetical protein
VADPSLTQMTTGPLVLGQSYSLSALFTFDPGTPPPGDTLLGVAVAFYANSDGANSANPIETFSGTPEAYISPGSFQYPFVISDYPAWQTVYRGFGGSLLALGDFSSGSVVFNSPAGLRGLVAFIYSTPTYPMGQLFYSDEFGYSFNFSTLSITGPAAATVGQGQATAISGVNLSESGNTAGETFTVTLADANGALSATGSGVSGDGTTSLTITGSLTQVNSDLATLTDTDATTPSDTITLNASDSLGNTAIPQTIAVTVNGGLFINSCVNHCDV